MMMAGDSEGFTQLLMRLSRPRFKLEPSIPIQGAETSTRTSPSSLSSDSSVPVSDPWQADFEEDRVCSNEPIPDKQNDAPLPADSPYADIKRVPSIGALLETEAQVYLQVLPTCDFLLDASPHGN